MNTVIADCIPADVRYNIIIELVNSVDMDDLAAYLPGGFGDEEARRKVVIDFIEEAAEQLLDWSSNI